MKGTIAHELGHLEYPPGDPHGRFGGDPYAPDQQLRYNNPDYHCGGNKTPQLLHPTACQCD